MLKILHDGDYRRYLGHQKEKLNVYLGHEGKKRALDRLASRHYKALKNRLRSCGMRGKKVLCLGARLGQEVRAFRDCKAFAVGIDLNPGPQNPYVHYGDFHDIQFPSKSVDVVYTNSLDHVFDFAKLTKGIKRILKDDGTLILEIQYGNDAGVPAEQYEACWWDSTEDVVKIFTEAEFYIVKQEDIDSPFKSKHVTMTLNKSLVVPVVPVISTERNFTRVHLSNTVAGIALELGVAAGDYSEQILQNPKVKRLYSIDRWGNDGRHNDAEYLSVLHRFRSYKSRSVVIRRSFDMAVSMFNPVFDFIYIDGYAHTGQDNGKTLEQWWPKLKPGGIFAGHDYHPKWQPTIEAVNRFVSRLGLVLHVTKEEDIPNQVFPSWYIFKPE